jgi:6-phosphofructokinase 2
MSSIVTITFSPCIDKSTTAPSVVPEKKLRCVQPVLEPGGGGINVARAIKKLGGAATAIFPSGGYTGKFFNYLLSKEDIDSVIIETSAETRENFIVVDDSTGNQYRFGMPGTLLKEDEWRACIEKISSIPDVKYLVASGSLPPGVPHDVFAILARLAKKANIRLIVDTSGEPLKEASDEGLFLLKPNIVELAFLAGKKELQQNEVKEIARKIITNGNVEVLVVSMGEEGCILVTDTIAQKITPPEIEGKSTVGAGDSMVAGIIHFLSQGKDITEAVKYGVACGSAATMNPGTELCNKDDADRLYEMVSTEDI